MRHRVIERNVARRVLAHCLAQPWRRATREDDLELVQDRVDRFGLVDLDRVDLARYDSGRAGAADGGDVQDRAVFDRLEFWTELILVAVFLQIAVECNLLHKAMAVRRNIVDRDILCPAEMSIDVFVILGSKCDFHINSVIMMSSSCTQTREMAYSEAGSSVRHEVLGLRSCDSAMKTLPMSKIKSRV